MAKKKKRKLQPHEKFFVKSLIWALCIALLVGHASWPREITMGQDTIQVQEWDTYKRGRFNVYLRIISTDGKVYDVTEYEIPLWKLKQLLLPGTELEVDYYYETQRGENNPDYPRSVTRMTLDGQLLSQEKPYRHTDNLVFFWLCPVFILFGFLNWASGEHLYSKWKKKRDKERKRRKKEGNIK